MNSIPGWTEKETRKTIAEIRKSLKVSMGLDSISFIKIERNLFMFNIKAKNGCGYRSCDVDEMILVDPATRKEVKQ